AVMRADAGFRTDNVLTFSLRLPNSKYPKAENWQPFYTQLVEKLRAAPGVTVVSAATIVPLDGHTGYFFNVEGSRTFGPNDPSPVVLQVIALPGYLDTMGMQLKSGRDFDARDTQLNAPKVVIVNETFAKFFWDKTDVLGKRVRWGNGERWTVDGSFTVIGVVKDMRHYGLDAEIRPEVFGSFAVNPASGMTIAMRTRTDPHTLAEPTRQIIRQLDADLPMFNIRTMSERLDPPLWTRRAYSWLFVAFAAVAMMLAAAGVYSVISFAVSQRTREIGIRMALGARPAQVLGGILRQGMALVGAGIVLGVIASQLTSGLLKSLLFSIGPRDLFTCLAVVAAIALVGLIANLVPARRAASIEPSNTLRAE